MRLLTVGQVLTITLVAVSSRAVETILPIVSDELGGVSLYGRVFSAFFLGGDRHVVREVAEILKRSNDNDEPLRSALASRIEAKADGTLKHRATNSLCLQGFGYPRVQ